MIRIMGRVPVYAVYARALGGFIKNQMADMVEYKGVFSKYSAQCTVVTANRIGVQ